MQNEDRKDPQEAAGESNECPETRGINENDEQNKTAEEIGEDRQQELCCEAEAAGEEGKAAAGEGEALPEQGEVRQDEPSKKEEADPVRVPESSVCYTPPYYTPTITVAPGMERATESSKKEKKHYGWIVMTVAICTLISMAVSFAVGSFSGYLAGLSSESKPNGVTDPNSATLTKNNGSISIHEVLESDADVYTEVSSVAAAVADSVVEIKTSKTESNFFGQYVTGGAGSGVILAQTATTGIIVTNYHVVQGAEHMVVRLTNGTEYEASYRGGDAAMDIAVLYITLQNGETLNCATLGDSSQLLVGQRVVAIGNPLGSLGGTVTDGIISALDRKINIDDNVMTLLQTNTAINPGNSGGGLFDMAGRLVGIVNAKQSAEGIEGLGFAIPINVIEEAIVSIIDRSYVQNRPTLGVYVTYVERYEAGLYVAMRFRDDTPLQENDRILSIDGNEIKNRLEFNALVASLTIGQQVQVRFVRNGRTYVATVTVMENTANW